MQDRITLEEVKQAFNQWRASKLHQKKRTPKSLCAQVKAIAPYYSKKQIIKTLAINLKQMNQYDSSDQPVDAVAKYNEASNAFIEVPIPSLSMIQQQLSSAQHDPAAYAAGLLHQAIKKTIQEPGSDLSARGFQAIA